MIWAALICGLLVLLFQQCARQTRKECQSLLDAAKTPADTLAVVIVNRDCSEFTQEIQIQTIDRTPFVP